MWYALFATWTFCNLADEHEVYYGEFLVQTVDLVVMGPVYEIRQVREECNSDHANVPVDDMKARVSFTERS